jgi:hypothetical protein
MVLLALCVPWPAGAGHGLMNAFAGIEWLPPAGTTPDQFLYPLDRLQEQLELGLAADDTGRLRRAQAQARERLAELEAMLRTGNRSGVTRAIEEYRSALDAASQILAATQDIELLRAHAEEILAQRYIVSTDYQELPRATRGLVTPMMDAAGMHYERWAARLPQRVKDALFFKEEEVRWSWDMAIAADEQGL